MPVIDRRRSVSTDQPTSSVQKPANQATKNEERIDDDKIKKLESGGDANAKRLAFLQHRCNEASDREIDLDKGE